MAKIRKRPKTKVDNPALDEFNSNIKRSNPIAILVTFSWIALYFVNQLLQHNRNSIDAIKSFTPDTPFIQFLLVIMPFMSVLTSIYILSIMRKDKLKNTYPNYFECFLFNLLITSSIPIFILSIASLAIKQIPLI